MQRHTQAHRHFTRLILGRDCRFENLRHSQKGPSFCRLGHRAATTSAALRRPPGSPVVYPTEDMNSAAAQSFNLTLQAILDGHTGFGDDSKLNSLALVNLIFQASDHSWPVVINSDSRAGN